MERRGPGATGPGLRSGLRPKFSKPNPSQTKPDQENALGLSWISSSDSGLFNGLRAIQTIQIKKIQLPIWRWSSAAAGQRHPRRRLRQSAPRDESVHGRGGGAIPGANRAFPETYGVLITGERKDNDIEHDHIKQQLLITHGKLKKIDCPRCFRKRLTGMTESDCVQPGAGTPLNVGERHKIEIASHGAGGRGYVE